MLNGFQGAMNNQCHDGNRMDNRLHEFSFEARAKFAAHWIVEKDDFSRHGSKVGIEGMDLIRRKLRAENIGALIRPSRDALKSSCHLSLVIVPYSQSGEWFETDQNCSE